jgi:hypothetical protein
MPAVRKRTNQQVRSAIDKHLGGRPVKSTADISPEDALDALLATLSLDQKDTNPTLSRRERFLAVFGPERLARAIHACGLDFEGPVRAYGRWPQKEIKVAKEKLLVEFKDEPWGDWEMVTGILQMLIKENNAQK